MSDTLVELNSVSKKFCRKLRRALWYGFTDLGGQLIGRDGSKTLRKDEFWAVKNVSFSIKRGETLGLIGQNGAGKTTILRMLNGLIKPDEGMIEVRGRMQALIALGAGFNPILTGRENVYINASVLGISKAEVDKRFDEIVDFSGIHEFIDTPVQSYSSGMKVRLGFAVAANMNPDVLLVDEVLAVGDLPFQAKCRNRIEELMKDGVAIILVSHNLHTISYICSRSLVLEKGTIIFEGDTQQGIDVYRSSLLSKREARGTRAGTGEVKIERFEMLDRKNMPVDTINVGDPMKFRIYYSTSEPIRNPIVNIAIYNQAGVQISGIRNDVDGVLLGNWSQDGYIELEIAQFHLLPNNYFFNATIFHADGFAYYDRIEDVARISVTGGHFINGTTYIPHQWNQEVKILDSGLMPQE